jgi:predicted metal-dependent phosphoesterase TrpH
VGGIDLHLHTTASDGKFSPEDIVKKAAGLGLRTIAITDHDSVDGVLPALKAARDYPELDVIPGVEISTDMPAGQAHVLGYFPDFKSPELTAALERFRNSRETRARGMIAKLHGLGIDIDWERVKEIAGQGSVGRPHITEAMLEKGYISSFNEAFTKYIGHNGPAYVEREKMTPVEAVELILSVRGLPVLAHPFTLEDPEAMIIDLKKAGLAGIEAYYKDYSAAQIDTLVKIAVANGLVATGGTDYHGINDNDEVMMGGVDVPDSAVTGLTALADKRMLKLANQ